MNINGRHIVDLFGQTQLHERTASMSDNRLNNRNHRFIMTSILRTIHTYLI
jgi:hypothetical protein